MVGFHYQVTLTADWRSTVVEINRPDNGAVWLRTIGQKGAVREAIALSVDEAYQIAAALSNAAEGN